ncbi:hypothetical protein [Hyphomicrobium sp. LHD-15]|uniref:hypothetical protein n=1 Tax=Hyphomicrobium sp. LHD-15 TaxID=3072142 RepID=UPI00280C72FD|nr:hypothetical protein [Hyphomicrobium sp. LHD-15]MDQ8699865.1 hypothetical protein [Hyphomicrobium sp. LHD-15]
MRILSMIASRKGVVLLFLGAIALTLWAHDVSTEVTDEDEIYAKHILAQAGYDHAALKVAGPADFESEVRTIKAVQDAVLTAAPDNKGLPFKTEREPRDIFERKYGLCYDRSRAIEKILSWLGFETRHVAIYSTADTSPLQALFTPQVASHAVSEALTRKGWMVVDSNARWIGLDQTRDAVSIDDIQSSGLRGWASESSAPINGIFRGAFIQIRGLYSRHGYFYPPYTPIPDFNFRQVVGNVVD